ncbi:helix-turn-helix domain-containing protein [Xylanimonas protaetiae]|nr:helix-turn-helix domain-containing protein [Xylanimonas protaetiae]
MWKRAVWASETLSSSEKLAALLFEEFAGASVQGVWVTTETLASMTGLSRRTAVTVRASLVTKGWLVETTAATPRTAARYALAIPDTEPAVEVPAATEPDDVKMVPGARVQHDGGPVHRVPAERSNVVRFPSQGGGPRELRTATPTYPRGADGAKVYAEPECDADGSRLRVDGSCPICSRLSSAVAL